MFKIREFVTKTILLSQNHFPVLYQNFLPPIKELKGFELLTLKKGETKIITFTLSNKELGFYDNDGNYLVEPGTFKIISKKEL